MSSASLIDRFGRVHDYLRISVTDQCNLRCLYCMPEEGMQFMESEQLLRYEEIAEVVKTAADFGISKIRITGGEPLVRKNLDQLISMISATKGIEDIALTTNGIFLEQMADSLKNAGLNRVNISLDTLDPARFRMIARNGNLQKVLKGIEKAGNAGLQPIKLNTVLLKGINEDEIGAFLKLSVDHPFHVRFIEYMPIGHDDDNWRNHYLPLSRVTEIAGELGYTFEPLTEMKGNGPSENFKIRGAAGSFGLIHPVSSHFCDNCNRLRLTADGNLKPCLFWVDELNVRPFIGQPEKLREVFMRALDVKPKNHEMAEQLYKESLSHVPTSRRMSQIGG